MTTTHAPLSPLSPDRRSALCYRALLSPFHAFNPQREPLTCGNRRLLELLEQHRRELGLAHVSISMPTLEEVFLAVTADSDAHHTHGARGAPSPPPQQQQQQPGGPPSSTAPALSKPPQPPPALPVSRPAVQPSPAPARAPPPPPPSPPLPGSADPTSAHDGPAPGGASIESPDAPLLAATTAPPPAVPHHASAEPAAGHVRVLPGGKVVGATAGGGAASSSAASSPLHAARAQPAFLLIDGLGASGPLSADGDAAAVAAAAAGGGDGLRGASDGESGGGKAAAVAHSDGDAEGRWLAVLRGDAAVEEEEEEGRERGGSGEAKREGGRRRGEGGGGGRRKGGAGGAKGRRSEAAYAWRSYRLMLSKRALIASRDWKVRRAGDAPGLLALLPSPACCCRRVGELELWRGRLSAEHAVPLAVPRLTSIPGPPAVHLTPVPQGMLYLFLLPVLAVAATLTMLLLNIDPSGPSLTLTLQNMEQVTPGALPATLRRVTLSSPPPPPLHGVRDSALWRRRSETLAKEVLHVPDARPLTRVATLCMLRSGHVAQPGAGHPGRVHGPAAPAAPGRLAGAPQDGV